MSIYDKKNLEESLDKMWETIINEMERIIKEVLSKEKCPSEFDNQNLKCLFCEHKENCKNGL